MPPPRSLDELDLPDYRKLSKACLPSSSVRQQEPVSEEHNLISLQIVAASSAQPLRENAAPPNFSSESQPRDRKASVAEVHTVSDMSQPKSPETIARAVQELEHLLAEAVQIAETAGISEAQRKPENAKQDRPMSPSRRPSEGLAKRVNTYLERASPEPVASPPSEDTTRAERDLAPDEEDVDEPISDNLRLIPPQPIAEPPNERKTKLSRDRRTSGQTSSSRNGRTARFLDIPEIRSRSNSTRVPNGQRQSLRPAPIIQLNNVDLDNEDAEEKDSLLGSRGDLEVPRPGHERHFSNMFGINSRQASMNMAHSD
ncbi:hypothetical protein LTR67_008920 [Exophiala xenobiotica]